VFHEFAVLDPGGAGGFAGAAVETFVNVIDERIGDGKVAQLDVDHLVDAAARGIGFEIPEAVGGAGVETKTAVDAASVVLVDGVEAGDERRGHGWARREGTMIRPTGPVRKRDARGCRRLVTPARSGQASDS